MTVLRRASFSWLVRHRWQLVLAVVGIAAGVTVMVAVDIATDSARRAFDLSMDAVNGEATHQIVAGPGGVDERLYAELRLAGGIRNIAPVVEGYVSAGETALTLLGVDFFAERGFRAWALPDTSGAGAAGGAGLLRSLLTEPGAVLLSPSTARRLGVAAGDRLPLTAGGRRFDARVTALLEGGGGRGLDDLLLADISTAQAWLDRHGRLSRIDVRVAADDAASLSRIEALLPAGTRVLHAAGRTRAVRDMSDAFTTNLTAMSLLALLVGVFLVYNSVSFTVLQRRELLGTLRALGLTRGEILRMVLAEALLLGAVGASLGLAGGVWLGHRLLDLVSRSINDLYFVVSVGSVTVTAATLIKGLAAGTGAALIAALVPALEAAASRPRLAMARSAIERRSAAALPVVAAIGLAVAGAAAVVLSVSGRSLVAGLVAVFMLLLGFALMVPLAVRQLARLAAPAAALCGGITGRLAIAGVGGSLSRTGVAVAALAVAVSATIGVTVMVDSFRQAVAAWVDDSLRADLYVGVGQGILDPDLVPALLAVDGIAAHSSSRRVWLETGAGRTRLTALDLPVAARAGTRLLDGVPENVWPAFEGGGALLVSASYAWRHGVGRGDSLTLPTDRGDRVFPVAAVYRSYDADLDAVAVSRGTYERFWDDRAIDSLGLYLGPEASADAVTQRLRAAGAGRQALVVRSNRELRELTLRIFDRTFVITDVLYWLAVSVALVGVLSAMLALQLERSREYAVLRAVGLTPGQLGALVGGQSAFIGIASGLAAMPLGLVMAFVLIEVINRRAFGWQMPMAVSPSALASAVALSGLAALVAGLYPAWRAARSRPATAMREE